MGRRTVGTINPRSVAAVERCRAAFAFIFERPVASLRRAASMWLGPARTSWSRQLRRRTPLPELRARRSSWWRMMMMRPAPLHGGHPPGAWLRGSRGANRPQRLGTRRSTRGNRPAVYRRGARGWMGGRALAEEAARRRPGLKVLFTTGYTSNAIVHHRHLDPGVRLIGKPFTYAELARKVRRSSMKASLSGRWSDIVGQNGSLRGR